MEDTNDSPHVAVVIPCYNEELTIGKVVADFMQALPEATIYVFDNASTDKTAETARRAGAEVLYSPRRGKGNVIRHMSNIVDADIYVLVDGDDTYLASAAPDLIRQFCKDQIHMLLATRLLKHEEGAFRVFHQFGNRLISKLISVLFTASITDVLTGYRVLSRDFVRVAQFRSTGFEIETEMTLQALAKNFSTREVPVEYSKRPEGSHSKLSTWADGYLILRTILLIFKDYKPLFFFSIVAALLAMASVVTGMAPIVEFYRTGLVYQVPRAILAAGLGVLATLALAVGLILDTINKYHVDNIELWKQHLKERQ